MSLPVKIFTLVKREQGKNHIPLCTFYPLPPTTNTNFLVGIRNLRSKLELSGFIRGVAQQISDHPSPENDTNFNNLSRLFSHLK